MSKEKGKECELCLTNRILECGRRPWLGRRQVWQSEWGWNQQTESRGIRLVLVWVWACVPQVTLLKKRNVGGSHLCIWLERKKRGAVRRKQGWEIKPRGILGNLTSCQNENCNKFGTRQTEIRAPTLLFTSHVTFCFCFFIIEMEIKMPTFRGFNKILRQSMQTSSILTGIWWLGRKMKPHSITTASCQASRPAVQTAFEGTVQKRVSGG